MDKGSLLTVVDSMNERIFPGISKKICRDESFISMGKIVFVYNIKSSLVLQMCLFFNSTYFPIWLLIIWSSYIFKYECFSWFPYVISGLGLAVMVILEAGRLYLGLAGNLSESVTELSTFWFITLLVQLPLAVVYLITAWNYGQILDICAQLLLGLFIGIELSVAFVTLRDVSRQQQFMSKTS